MRATLVVLAGIACLVGSAPTRSDGTVGSSEIYVIHLDGSGRRHLTSSPLPDLAPVVSPDGRSIAFIRGIQWQGVGSVDSTDIWTMRLDGHGQAPFASGPHDELDPSWAPDSRTLAFVEVNYESCRPGERYCSETSVAIGGRAGRRRLVANAQAPQFASATKAIVFEDRINPNGKPRAISRISAGGRGYRVLTRWRVSAPAWKPVWSPDGRQVAFQQGAYVWLIRSDGRNKRRLAVGNTPVWSPNGARLALIDSKENLVDLAPSGASPRVVTSHVHDFAWSPNGKQFAVVRRAAGQLDQLYVVRANGRGLRAVTREPAGVLGRPAWARDGSKIFYTAA
jgi:Tol biopolymer transport system component